MSRRAVLAGASGFIGSRIATTAELSAAVADLERPPRVWFKGPALRMLYRAARFGAGGPQLDGPWLRHDRYRGIGPTPTTPAATGHHSHGNQRFSGSTWTIWWRPSGSW